MTRLVKTFQVESLFLWAFVVVLELELTQKRKEKDSLPQRSL